MDRAMQLALDRCSKSDDVVEEARRAIKREIFCQGYRQAEKDLALTWEDIASLVRIMFDYHMETGSFYLTDEDLCKEVLKRFNEQRGKK